MSEEICGYETTDGEPCKNTPQGDNGHCHLPQHNPDDNGVTGSPNDYGRPSKFTGERARRACQAARRAKSLAGCAREAGVSIEAIRAWMNDESKTFKNKEGYEVKFPEAFTRARSQGENLLIEQGIQGQIDSSMAKFLLSCSYGYTKTERKEIVGEDGGPVEVAGFVKSLDEIAEDDDD